MKLALPYPPSINHYWRHYRGRTVISREGRRFREDICDFLATSAQRSGNGPRKPPAGGRIALCMDAFPPDRRRRDLDNIQKPVLDALEHAEVYLDDSQIDLLLTRRRASGKPGRIEVQLDELPLRRCPLCGAAINPENN
ncbi:RusA family crossover junction endodeoxyribonuclease [Planctomycetales bacterium ZRK34]|nr:RusA family crossover junction endodeoxyribonuclease [Planctomycetales bacterium ZRK34]